MPLNLQAKILRLLQEQIFERVGGNETVHTNVRIIASTHRDLKARSAEGKFRADLFYRLSVFNIHLPALRERTGDLPILVEHFLDFHSREMGRQIREVSAEAMARLQRYHWPGNIRELQSVMKQAILRAHGNVLHSASLPELNDQALPASTLAPAEDTFDIDLFVRNLLAAGASDLYAKVHAKIDHRLLTHVLDHLGGNQQKAARLLGMARETLRLKLRELGLSVSHIVKAEDEVEGACPLGIERRCTRLRTSGSAGNTK
jgi:two-component system nitrogen regulation response regulator GlnG